MSRNVRDRRQARHTQEQVQRSETLARIKADQARSLRRARVAWGVGVLAASAAVAGMLLSSRATSTAVTGTAPAFTLASTAGVKVSLADFSGRPVLLYFNEGAGCDACFYQMVDIEKNRKAFDDLGVTVLPVAANPVGDLTPELERFKLTTPWLSDSDVAVSTAYGTVGRGMHAGLPGHGFVLVDADGQKKWYGEYPSMYLPADKLADHVRDHLA